MIDPLVSLAFFTALLGSGHCLGMCGGLVAALSLSPQGRSAGFGYQLVYHLGRITTYTLLGSLAGWLGSTMNLTSLLAQFTRGLLIATDLLIIVLGLGTAGVWSRLNLWRLEFSAPSRILGGFVSGLKRFPPLLSAFPVGLIMGLLPCGFLYAMILTAAQSAFPGTGAQVMLAFGLGTLPALLMFGGTAHILSVKARNWMLRGAGFLVAVMGCYNLYRHLWKG